MVSKCAGKCSAASLCTTMHIRDEVDEVVTVHVCVTVGELLLVGVGERLIVAVAEDGTTTAGYHLKHAQALLSGYT